MNIDVVIIVQDVAHLSHMPVIPFQVVAVCG